MSIIMVGIDFHRADVAAREPVSFVRGQVENLVRSIRSAPDVEGCVLLATCNRTECYIHTEKEDTDVLALLCRAAGLDEETYRACSVTRRDDAAVAHIYAVAAGMESQILGDDQIITQVRQALAIAREAGTADSVLDTLFRRAVTAGKRVKTETRLVGVPDSAARRASERAADFFGGLEGRRAVVIGNGEMGRLAAGLLRAAGCAVTVTLRTYRHGETIVPAGCATHPYEDRCAVIEGADLVVSATTSPHATLDRVQVEGMTARPRLLIDLAIPRDLDPAIGELPGVTVWNLDDLKGVTQENEAERARAREILEEEQREWNRWYAYRAALPVIARLKETAFDRVQHDRSYEGLREDAEGMAELAVRKTIDMLLGGMKEIVTPARLQACLEHMQKGAGK